MILLSNRVHIKDLNVDFWVVAVRAQSVNIV